MWKSCTLAMGTLACLALYAVPASAQQRNVEQSSASKNQVRQEGQPRARVANKPVTDASPAGTDKMIAGMLALCNEEEAAAGKFASEHSKNEDVQKFAKLMAKDHSMMAKELQKWAPEATLMNDEKRDDPKAGTGEERMAFNPLRVHQQIATRSLASMEKSMGAKKGSEFDMAYVGSQCVMHQQMIDKASVLREYATPELQTSIDKGIEAAQSHLNQAHQLIEKLADEDRDSN